MRPEYQPRCKAWSVLLGNDILERGWGTSRPGDNRGLPGASDSSGHCVRVKPITQTGFLSSRVELLKCRWRISEWLGLAKVEVWPVDTGEGQAQMMTMYVFTGCPVKSKN